MNNNISVLKQWMFFGAIAPIPFPGFFIVVFVQLHQLYLDKNVTIKPVGKHLFQRFLCEHIGEYPRPLCEFHIFVN